MNLAKEKYSYINKVLKNNEKGKLIKEAIKIKEIIKDYEEFLFQVINEKEKQEIIKNIDYEKEKLHHIYEILDNI